MDERKTEQKAGISEKKTDNNPHPSPTKNGPNNKIPQSKQEKCFNEQRSRKYANMVLFCSVVVAISTVFIAVVTYFYMRFAGQQVCEMRKATIASVGAADAAKKAADIAYDTYRDGQDSFKATMNEMKKQSVAMSETAKSNQMIAETTRLRDRAFIQFFDLGRGGYDKEFWVIKMGVINQGNVPARNVMGRYAFIRDRNSVEAAPWKNMKNWKQIQLPSVIGPKQRIENDVAIKMSDIEIIKKDYPTTAIIAMWEVTYFDGFHHKRRITQMSRILRFDKNGDNSLQFTKFHNCTDEDCQSR